MHNKGLDDMLLLFIGVILSLIYIYIVIVATSSFGGTDVLATLTVSCGNSPDMSSNKCIVQSPWMGGRDCECSIQKCEGPLNSGTLWLLDKNNIILTTPGFRFGSGKFSGGFFNNVGDKFTVYATCGAINCNLNDPVSCIPYIQKGKYGETQIEAVAQ